MKMERWHLVWSAKQACPHIERESVGLRTNMLAFQENRALDYVPIGIFDSMEEANAMADQLRDVMRERHAARVPAEEAEWK